MRARRELRFTLCVLLSGAAIIGMLPVTQALAASPGFDANHIDNSVLPTDGLISRLLDGDDDDEHDDDKADDKKDKGGRHDNKGGNDDNDDDEHDDDKADDKKDNGGNNDDKGGNDNDDDQDGDDEDPDDDSEKGKPEAHDQSLDIDEDSSIRIELEASSDRDDAITFAIVEEPENGKLLEFDASGSVTYEPAANFHGSDSFAFKASDGDEESRPATVTIQVSSINDLPVAFASSITTREGKSVSFELSGTDVETKDLQYVIVSEPSHGKLEGTAPSLTYKPDDHFDGTDELTFKVSDETSDSDLATVMIRVNEKDKDRDESDRWWEKAPVTSQPTESASLAIASTGTEDAPAQTEPEQVTVIAQPIPTIVESPIISTVLIPNEIAEARMLDLVAPQLIIPELLNVIATSKDGAIINFDAKAIDDTDGEIPVSCSPGPGSMVPIGTFNIVCEATDAAGNSALNSFMVAVSPATAGSIASSSSFLVPALLMAVLGVGVVAYFRFKPMRKQRKSAV